MAKKVRRCNISGLVIFEDELAAKYALARRVWKDKGEKRYFECRGHYHLTAQEERKTA